MCAAAGSTTNNYNSKADPNYAVGYSLALHNTNINSAAYTRADTHAQAVGYSETY
jgi:hypothetical protein